MTDAAKVAAQLPESQRIALAIGLLNGVADPGQAPALRRAEAAARAGADELERKAFERRYAK